ncbi:MAG: Mannose-1-phosphate guanylyltransferase, partial [uncultured Phycisphaerae bacterium]
AIRRHHGGRRGDAAVAALAQQAPQATAPRRPGQEPPAAQLRPPPRHPARRPHLRVYRLPARAARARGPAGAADGQPARRADGPRHGQRGRLFRRRPARARPRRRDGHHHRRPRDRARRHVPGGGEDRVRRGRGRPGGAGHVRHRPHARPHGPRVRPPRRAAHGPRQAGRRVPRAGLQGEARQAHRRPVRGVGAVLLEQRDVRLAVRHGAERAGRPPPRVARGPGADRGRLGHAAARRGVERDVPDAPEDQHRLRGDGAGFSEQGQGARDGGRDAGAVARRRLVARAGRDAHERRAQQRRRLPGTRAARQRRQHHRLRRPGAPRLHDRRQRHDHRPHPGRHARVPQERGPAREGPRRAREGEVRGTVHV